MSREESPHSAIVMRLATQLSRGDSRRRVLKQGLLTASGPVFAPGSGRRVCGGAVRSPVFPELGAITYRRVAGGLERRRRTPINPVEFRAIAREGAGYRLFGRAESSV